MTETPHVSQLRSPAPCSGSTTNVSAGRSPRRGARFGVAAALFLIMGCGDNGGADPAADATIDAATDADSGGDETGTDAVSDPCVPNPCLAANRSRCTVEVGAAVCGCDLGFAPAGDGCSAVADCAEVTCSTHASCVVRSGVGICECDAGYHASAALCCPSHASEAGGSCQCDPGYGDDGAGGCLATPDNPCATTPCAGGAGHRNRCVVDATAAAGYRCDCNLGYADVGGLCQVPNATSCSGGATCQAGYCEVPGASGMQCLVDEDCLGTATFCNAAATGGICLGCADDLDCPGAAVCGPYASCALPCAEDAACPFGRCITSAGFCGQTTCVSNQDCLGGARCVDEDGDGAGLCQRQRCAEVSCTPTHPTGTCSNGGTCLYGDCVTSCSPSPCDQEPNKTVCSGSGAAVACGCDPGYQPDALGQCQPATGGCTGGMTCEAGRCVDRADPGFVCATDADCGAGLTCTPTLPSGQCNGCSATATCPSGTACVAGYCLRSCTLTTDCAANMACNNGYCGRKGCASGADCPGGYVCVTGGDGQGTCNRAPCP